MDRMCTSGLSSNTHWRLSVLHRDINRLWSTVLISCLRCSQAPSAGCWRPATYKPASKPLPPYSQKPRATGFKWLQRCDPCGLWCPTSNPPLTLSCTAWCGLQSQRVSRRCSKHGLHLTPTHLYASGTSGTIFMWILAQHLNTVIPAECAWLHLQVDRRLPVWVVAACAAG